MGLFDKLREVVNTVVDSTQGTSDPLSDDVVKKYYEMIYGMRTSLTWSGNESADENSRARRYVEFLLGEACDDEKFKKAVELTNLSRTDYPKNKLEEQLKAFNKTLKDLKKYRCDTETAYNVCYKELVAEFKSEYNMILDVIKDDVNCKLFGQGLYIWIYEIFEYLGSIMRNDITYIVISNSFYDGNTITRKVVLEYLLDIYNNRVKNKKPDSYENATSQIEKMALKALHFEKYGKDRVGYTTITEEDCREFVLSDKYYKKKLAEHPFDQDTYVKRYVDNIMEWSVFRKDYSSYNGDELFWLNGCDDYFIDAACNLAWKEIAKKYKDSVNSAGENICESKNITDVVNMLCNYFGN